MSDSEVFGFEFGKFNTDVSSQQSTVNADAWAKRAGLKLVDSVPGEAGSGSIGADAATVDENHVRWNLQRRPYRRRMDGEPLGLCSPQLPEFKSGARVLNGRQGWLKSNGGGLGFNKASS
ncbi:hypothetical protein V6N13_108635 [Hibiscus sabdariffa]